MPPVSTTISSNLERFKNLFSKTNCYYEGDLLRCVFPSSLIASRKCSEANLLIDRLRIDLVAIYSYGESFIVKSSEVDAI